MAFLRNSIYSILTATIILPVTLFAETGYVPLTPGGEALGLSGVPSIHALVNTIFKNALLILGILAVIMIIRGGAEYMSSSIFNKGTGKTRLTNAIGGIVLALCAWLILQTINPQLLNVTLNFVDPKLSEDGTVTVDASPGDYRDILSETIRDTDLQTGVNSDNFNLVQTEQGLAITPNRVDIDTDGKNRPPFLDPHWQNETSYPGLDANTDSYVVVPIGSKIPLGTKVTMINHTTGRRLEGIVGDRGPTQKGYGELSLYAARELGAWIPGVHENSVEQHDITYIFHTD